MSESRSDADADRDPDPRSGSGSDSASGRPSASEAPDRSEGEKFDSEVTVERTAVFRVVKPGAKTADAKTADAKPKADTADSGKAPARPGGRAPAWAKPDAAASAEPSTDEADKPGAADDSERTAVFRAVKPGSGSGSAAAKSGAAGPAKPPAAGPAKPPAAGDSDSERTAVFRAPKPGSGSGPAAPAKPASEDSDSERTAVFRAVKPQTAAPAADKPAASRPAPPKPAGAAGAGKPSTFVPLRTDDRSARGASGSVPAASPKPAGPAAASSAPAQARTATPPRTPASAPGSAAAAASAAVPERTERTTQQPLPPRPPLDLLAELTNNPPPPPSPMRTFVRRLKIYTPIAVLLLVVLAVVQLVRPLPEPTLKMTAKGSFTFDGAAPAMPWPKEGQAYMAASGLGTVGSFGEQKPVPIGSVAKTMTAYVILKNHPMKKGEKGQMIDIDKAAVEDGKKESEGESTVNTLKEGDKISQYDALAALMIPSANNVARLLARWDAGGDQEAFVKKMNDAAKELGMTNTTYTDPSGLEATTVSTAEDQVKLGLKVVEMPELIAITKLNGYTDQYGKWWRNYNDLIAPGNGAVGIKTGSTTKAGGNLLFAAEKKVGNTNQLIVGAVLAQYGVPILGTAINHSKNIMVATQKSLTNATVVKKGETVGYVDDGLGGQTPVVATADVQAVGWPSLTVKLKLSGGDGKLPQTATAGTEVGMLTVGEGASQVKVPVALKSDLAAPSIGSKLTRIG
ncbi:D-alanyl-D-alanine carboxypeptidase family protein [Streptomyces sp. NPDC127106]|uniref:D-alanyl-D-alanine carboxypeptidase family protein n=1 Tax=Streptomyces sp. NPDC127106 TaxID=3345360 RepID=UPI0036254F3C